jgi:hypothetical protein
MPDEPIGWLLLAVFLVTLALFLVLSLDSCSLFSPVAQQEAMVPELPRGGVWVADINDGPPLVSTPHRMIVWRDWSKENDGYHFVPETSEPNAFSALENVPVTLGSMIPSGAPAAAVLGAGL